MTQETAAHPMSQLSDGPSPLRVAANRIAVALMLPLAAVTSLIWTALGENNREKSRHTWIWLRKNDKMNSRQAHKTVYYVVAGVLLTVDMLVFAGLSSVAVLTCLFLYLDQTNYHPPTNIFG
jgi:hypothetical protein